MMTVTCTRLLLVAVTLLAVFNTVASFMCYTKEVNDDSTSVTFCSSGTCYSVGGTILNLKESKKGCADESHEDGCVAGGIPGFSAHTCFCSFPLCNSAYTPTVILPMLVLPALMQRLLS